MKQLPISVKNPQIIYFNKSLAKELGLEFSSKEKVAVAEYLSGNKIPEGAALISQAYAGHQFGHFTMLGDGRAHILGEHITPNNKSCLLYTSPSPRDRSLSRMPSSA